MKLATVRRGEVTRAVRCESDRVVDLGVESLEQLLQDQDWRSLATATDGEPYSYEDVDFVQPILWPGKILCIGLNYRHHILEMGRELPLHPTVFAKYPEALLGPTEEIRLPPESECIDWEGELVVVIGGTVRRASQKEAAGAIAGFTVMNDVTARDWQYRSIQWLQGKTFESTTPVGPVLVTPDELPGGLAPRLSLTTEVDGEVVQSADTGDLVFGPVELVEYLSTILTLRPGDLIATGTPGGVGHARDPQRYLHDGSVLTTTVEGIGELRNVARS